MKCWSHRLHLAVNFRLSAVSRALCFLTFSPGTQKSPKGELNGGIFSLELFHNVFKWSHWEKIKVERTIPWCDNGVTAVTRIRCNNHFSPRASDSPHRSSLNHYHQAWSRCGGNSTICQGWRRGGGVHLPLSPQPICHVKYHDVLMEVRFRRWPRGEISTPTLPVTLDLLPQRWERRADRGRGRWGGIEGKTRRRPEANPPPCRGIRCFQQSRRSASAEKEAGPAIDEVWCKTIWAENEMTEVWDTCGGSLPGGTCLLLQDTGRSLCRFGMPRGNGLHWAASLSLPPVCFGLKIMCKSLFHSRCWCSLWLQRR